MNKKRLLIVSDSVKRTTGYSTVAKNIIKRLSDDYEIAQLGLADAPAPVKYNIYHYSQLKDHSKCCKKGTVIEYTAKNDPMIKFLNPTIKDKKIPFHEDQKSCIRGENVKVDNYAYDSIYFVIQHFKPDIIISINDIWGLYNLNYLKNRECYKFIPYLAIDSDCMFPFMDATSPRPGLPRMDTIQTIGTTDKTIVFTDWAKEVINKTCEIVTNGKRLGNISVISHGVDTNIWKPLPEEDRKDIRKNYFRIKESDFLIGTIARNQSRKNLDANIRVLKRFIDKYEDSTRKVKMYFHCSLNDRMGWDLQWLAKYYGVLDRCIFNKDLRPGVGPTDQELNEIVGAFDTHLLLANSEGFCLPILETLSAGIPNIATNYSAHADWGKDAILFSKIESYRHEVRTGFIKAYPDIKHATHQLKLLYDSKKMRNEYSKKGIKLAHKLDWNNIAEQWKEFIDGIDVSDLDKDRYSEDKYFPTTKEEAEKRKFDLKIFDEKDINKDGK